MNQHIGRDGLRAIRRMWTVCPCRKHTYPGWRMVKVRRAS